MRYIALFWNPSRSRASTAAQHLASLLRLKFPQWQAVASATGYGVYAPVGIPASRAYFLPHSQGVVLGTLFERSGARDIHTGSDRFEFAADEARQIMQSAGKRLVTNYWGSYVAFLTDPTSGEKWIVHGPYSHIACFMVEHHDVRIVFSSTPDIVQLGLLSFSINWGYVAGALLSSIDRHQTGLCGVRSLSDGECLHIRSDRVERRRYWDVLDIAREQRVDHKEEAATGLREQTRRCVVAWASQYRSIMVRLSGGLDSSIILSCLREVPLTRVLAVNRYSQGANEDERRFARVVAQDAGCELIELPRSANFDVDRVFQARATETPRAYLRILGQQAAEDCIARAAGAQAVFSGSGGDELYYGGGESLATADWIHDHGLTPDVIGIALGAAMLQGWSIWHVLREGVLKGIRPYRWHAAHVTRPLSTLVNWDVVDRLRTSDDSECSWFDESRYVPPGKQQQIARLSASIGRGGAAPYVEAGDPEGVSPLLSQPLVELCLRIPSYVLTSGGVNRALARRAFAGVVPEAVLRRRSKGGQELHTAEIFTRHLAFMRELMLDGHLVRQGILDRKKVDAALSGGPSGVLLGMSKLSKHAGTEVWLRLWEKHGASIPDVAQLQRPDSPISFSRA